MPKRRTKSGPVAPFRSAAPKPEPPPAPAPKPAVPWWKEPAKLSALVVAVLVVVELAGRSRLPPKIVGYIDPLILFFGALSIVLSIMRRWENR